MSEPSPPSTLNKGGILCDPTKTRVLLGLEPSCQQSKELYTLLLIIRNNNTSLLSYLEVYTLVIS